MEIRELIGSARDTLTVRRVYGDPYEKDGVTIIPTATIRGGLGSGSVEGTGEAGRAGGGFGMNAHPVGIFVLKDGVVRWRPVVDIRAALRAAVLGLAVLAMVTARLFGRKRFSRVIALRRRSPRRVFRAFLAR